MNWIYPMNYPWLLAYHASNLTSKVFSRRLDVNMLYSKHGQIVLRFSKLCQKLTQYTETTEFGKLKEEGKEEEVKEDGQQIPDQTPQRLQSIQVLDILIYSLFKYVKLSSNFKGSLVDELNKHPSFKAFEQNFGRDLISGKLELIQPLNVKTCIY